jgi:hypothetical protein
VEVVVLEPLVKVVDLVAVVVVFGLLVLAHRLVVLAQAFLVKGFQEVEAALGAG